MEWFAAPGQWVGRLVFQRGLAAVYLVAFTAAAGQFRALLGERGMLPVPRFTAAVPFRRSPSLFHLHYSDRFFAGTAVGGALLSAAVLAGAADAVPLWASVAFWLALWAGYLSIVNVGQVWYGFGWESLLVEAGFLAALLGNARCAPPVTGAWALRWLLFRVEFGAGLIKLRGDPCWRSLTCLRFHHETQPMPGPLSWFFHRLPDPLHRVEAAANHVAQLVAPVLLFVPGPVGDAAAGAVVVTQLWLVASGNFAWLNWLTVVIALGTVDDAGWAAVPPGSPGGPHPQGIPGWFAVAVSAATALIAVLSVRPARNLLSRRQAMNASFDPLRLVNAYGAFGSVSRVRHEVAVEGTDDPAAGPDAVWREYGFRGKPGEPDRMPRQWAPYHLRLDWMMWFAALSPRYAEPWFPVLAARLLEGDRATLRLLRHDPFPDRPPALLRATLYRYRFTGRDGLRRGRWWEREEVGRFMAPVTLSDLRRAGVAD